MPRGRAKWTPEQIKAKKDTEALAKKERENQTITITDKWKIVRFDELNWATLFEGKHPITGEIQDPDRPWFYGRLIDALKSIPHKLLNEDQKKDLRDILIQMKEINDLLDHLRFYKFDHLKDNE